MKRLWKIIHNSKPNNKDKRGRTKNVDNRENSQAKYVFGTLDAENARAAKIFLEP